MEFREHTCAGDCELRKAIGALEYSEDTYEKIAVWDRSTTIYGITLMSSLRSPLSANNFLLL